MSIKVCHMSSAHPPEDQRIFIKQCTSLAQAGYDTYLVVRGKTYDKNGVHIIGVGEFAGSRFQRIIKLAKLVYKKALEINAEIYQIHDPELLPYALKLKKKGKRVVFDSHEYYIDQFKKKPYLPSWVCFLLSHVYEFYENYVLKRIDAVIFPCLKDGVQPFAGRCKRIATLNNVPLLSELYVHYDESVKKYVNSICYVGGLTKSRGITEVVKAAALSNATAYIAGDFSTSYKNEINAMPESRAMKYLGQLNRQQVLDLLQHCQIGMATIHNVGQYNQFDNLPTKCYEYMALGLPIILTKAKYNEKVNEQYQFGICVNAEDEKEIAEAITYLLTHPVEAKRMGENGRKAIHDEFNWEKEKEKLLSLYEELSASVRV